MVLFGLNQHEVYVYNTLNKCDIASLASFLLDINGYQFFNKENIKILVFKSNDLGFPTKFTNGVIKVSNSIIGNNW